MRMSDRAKSAIYLASAGCPRCDVGPHFNGGIARVSLGSEDHD